MHYDYVVILKRENASKTDLVSLLLLTFSILAFLYVQIRNGLQFFFVIASLILITGLVINIFRRSRGNEMQYRNWLFAAGLFWLAMPFFQWMFIPFVFFALLETQAKYPLEIGFYTAGIVMNTFIKKRISWNALQSVILKDGLLTIDFRDNQLIQKEVLDDDEPEADEDEFNDWCRSKLVNLP